MASLYAFELCTNFVIYDEHICPHIHSHRSAGSIELLAGIFVSNYYYNSTKCPWFGVNARKVVHSIYFKTYIYVRFWWVCTYMKYVYSLGLDFYVFFFLDSSKVRKCKCSERLRLRLNWYIIFEPVRYVLQCHVWAIVVLIKCLRINYGWRQKVYEKCEFMCYVYDRHIMQV